MAKGGTEYHVPFFNLLKVWLLRATITVLRDISTAPRAGLMMMPC